MKRLIAASAIVFLFSIPVISYGQPEQNVQKAQPVTQRPLVREGNFAIKLVEALKLGTAKNETEAETILAAVGIAPKNGWIADHPLTPDIIGELRNAIGMALDSGKLVMKKDEVLMAVQLLVDNQWSQTVAPGEEQAREYGDYSPPASEGYEPYYYPEPYYSPYYSYNYPYPYYYGGYYYPYPVPYPRGGFIFRGFRGGFGGRGFRGGGGHGGHGRH